MVALQSAGRDEVIIQRDQLAGLEPLRREQSGWEELRELLGGITQAYVVAAGAKEPRLVFATKEREAVETARARIGLAETTLVLDSSGAYRAEQTYRVDNTTEQFLVIELPEEARLWTALVAGQPVKPTQVPAAKTSRLVPIPLVKTAPGDLDYAVVLKYGGRMPALGTVRAIRSPVRLPLVRTVNIKVELSQVRLHLPETYRWYDFDGTMRLAGEEEDLMAGFVSYQTKQVERLTETLRQKVSPYARQRAVGNIKQLRMELEVYHDTSATTSAANVKLREEAYKNLGVLQQADEEIGKLRLLPEKEATFDNRARLNIMFGDQDISRARNVVQDSGPNWDQAVDEQMPAKALAPVQFNEEWLDRQQLSNRPKGPQPTDADRLPLRLKGKGGVREGKPARPQPQGQFRGGYLPGDKAAPEPSPAGEKGGRPSSDQPTTGQPGGYGYDAGRGQLDVQGKSRGELERRSRSHYAVMADAPPSMRPEPSGRSLAAAIGRRVAPGGTEGVTGGGAPAAPAGEAALPAGLASLDVQLPTRGTLYLFTTPGGQVEITAHAAPRKLVANLITAGLTLLALLVALLVIRFARRGGFRPLAGRAGSWCLILLGLVALLVFPVIGLAALVAGIAAKMRRLASRRRAPATAEVQTELVTPEVVGD